jgi:hypothetical protein
MKMDNLCVHGGVYRRNPDDDIVVLAALFLFNAFEKIHIRYCHRVYNV